jgi:hypothetical protein
MILLSICAPHNLLAFQYKSAQVARFALVAAAARDLYADAIAALAVYPASNVRADVPPLRVGLDAAVLAAHARRASSVALYSTIKMCHYSKLLFYFITDVKITDGCPMNPS